MNLKYILIIVILAAFVGGGILAYQYWLAPKEEIKPAEEVTTDETANWKTYRNEKYGLEFKYPIDLRVKEEGNVVVEIYSEKQSMGLRLPVNLAADVTLDKWIASDSYYPAPEFKGNLTVGGEQAQRQTISGIEGGLQDIIYVIHRNKGYKIFLSSSPEPVFIQILSTVKFID